MTSPLSLAGKTLALGFGAAAVLGAAVYPMQRTWLPALLLLYLALLCWRRQLWLYALPVWLPALDLAPWTGWFFLEEIDLLLCVTAAFGYWHLGADPPHARVSAAARIALAGFTLACLIGLLHGVFGVLNSGPDKDLPAWPAIDANAFNNYLSPYNGLRIGKAWLWALVLLPLLNRAAGPALINLRRYFVPGMLSGLALVAGADVWERMLFPGLSNFSSDYRTSAPFSAMHTGGAALDGYLALSLPFVACWLLTRHARARTASALALLAVGAYAALSTFSRGLYAGLACSAALLALFLIERARRGRPGPQSAPPSIANAHSSPRRLLLGALLAGAATLALARMFGAGGYRGLAAAVGVLGAAWLLAGWPLPRRLLPAALLCAAAIELPLAALLGRDGPSAGLGWLKAPYLLFLLSALGFGASAWRVAHASAAGVDSADNGARAAALIAFLCLIFNMFWIARHWGGTQALGPAALVGAVAVALIAANHAARAPLWRIDRASATALAAGAMLVLLAIPIGASYYASERFAGSAGDWRNRVRHWRHALAMMDGGAPVQALGMGLGTFPATYYWHNRLGETPASLRYLEQDGNRFLRLGTPVYPLGYGEVLRLLQRVALEADGPYLLALDVRRAGAPPLSVTLAPALLRINICERLLLYPQGCVNLPLRLGPVYGTWQHYQVAFQSGPLGRHGWPLRVPVQIELAAEGGPGVLDIDNVSLRDGAGQAELIANGSFSDANNYWFFSSDRHHLPWHVKNFALNLFFELGWLGLLSMLALLGCALGRLYRLAREGRPDAAVRLAAVAGFQVVGLFDSLLDVPRLSLLFFLVLYTSLLQPAGATPRPTKAAHEQRPSE